MNENTKHTTNEPITPAWNRFYLLAGIGLVISIGFVLLDFGMSFTVGDIASGSLDAAGWFAEFQDNWFVGLRYLGLFNIINTTLTIPLYLALHHLHKQKSPALAALALSLFLVGTAIYGGNNRALTMLSLSQQHAAAGPEQRALIEAAGTAALAQGEDFTPGSFTGLFINSVASLKMMVVILQGRVFRRWIGIVGLVGMLCLLVFTTAVTFIPSVFELAMLLAMVGGLCMLVWNFAVAAVMFRLSVRRSPAVEALPAA